MVPFSSPFRQRIILAGFVLTSVFALAPAAQSQSTSTPYVWKNVMLGGGGSVPGIILHPKVPDLAYIRTDVGGSYRWDSANSSWVALQDMFAPSEWNLYGAETMAIDPSDATGNTVYLMTGKYDASWAKPKGGLYKSTDRGTTWVRTPLEVGGSSNTEQVYGERLAVDPNNGRHILYASKLQGLWRSLNGATTWGAVDGAPQGLTPKEGKPETKNTSGLTFVVFDANSGVVGPDKLTKIIYVGVSGGGVGRSQDGGATWEILVGSPVRPRRAVVGTDGSLIVTHDGGVAKWASGTWSDVTPPRKDGYQAIAIDPRDPNHLLTSPGLPKHGLPVFRSTDGGKSWREVKGARNQTAAWWPEWHWFSATGSLAFDPFHPKRAWATDWYGTYRTEDITAPEVKWTNYVRGHEEIVTVGALTTIPVGNIKLFSGTADVGGFDHLSLDEFPKENIWAKGFPGGFTNTGIAWQPSNPLYMARVGVQDWRDPGTGGYSLDGGVTWKLFSSLPYKGIRGGRVAIAASGNRILWTPQQGNPYFTDDFGKSWTQCGTGDDLKYTVRGQDIFQFHQPLAADGGDPNRFYIFKRGKLWRSDDGGVTWRVVKEVEDEGTHMLYSVPGKANQLWLSMNFHGLRRSNDGGETWERLGNVSNATMFCLGKNPPGKAYPAIFVQGIVNKQAGYFRSDDEGKSWLRIDTPQQQIGDQPNIMAGDWQQFGRVFVGTNGRGILYGEPGAVR